MLFYLLLVLASIVTGFTANERPPEPIESWLDNPIGKELYKSMGWKLAKRYKRTYAGGAMHAFNTGEKSPFGLKAKKTTYGRVKTWVPNLQPDLYPGDATVYEYTIEGVDTFDQIFMEMRCLCFPSEFGLCSCDKPYENDMDHYTREPGMSNGWVLDFHHFPHYQAHHIRRYGFDNVYKGGERWVVNGTFPANEYEAEKLDLIKIQNQGIECIPYPRHGCPLLNIL